MNNRIAISLVLLLACFYASGQTETNYLGNLIKSGPATSIPVSGTEDGPYPIGFSFNFFGNNYTQFYISDNGLVMFSETTAQYNTPVTIPNPAAPNNYIAAFWDTLQIDASGKILYTTIGASPNRKLIIQYRNMGFYPNPVFLGTFTVILYETTNTIQVQYRVIVDSQPGEGRGREATIGIENSSGTAGVLHSFKNPAAVSSGQAISFIPDGPGYVVNANAVYDPVYLTQNLSLPEPGIVKKITPPLDAVIGPDQTFEWESATNATNYILFLSHYSDLRNYSAYYPGSDTVFNISGLLVDTTYFWGVFAENSTGRTWSEVRRFYTSSTPPLTAVPRSIWIAQGDERLGALQYTGGDASAKTATITSLPGQGVLYQVSGGVKGTLIATVPSVITDPEYRYIYVASGGIGNGAGNFSFKFSDNTGESAEAEITVNVSPPGVPNFLVAARNQNVEVQFDRKMNDPAGKHDQFSVKVENVPAAITGAALKPGDPYTIILTLATPIISTDTVTVAYTKGSISATTGGLLESFSPQPVTLLAQNISFTTNLSKKFGDPPFTLSATSTSGLPFKWGSADLLVATIPANGNTVTIVNVGFSEITAFQAGNLIYAPARYIRTLTVSKGDQTITFNPLPEKSYGDPDFIVSATSDKGLPVTFTSSDPLVATVTGNSIHIVGGGAALITASQQGTAQWNPASAVQTLTVKKAILTFTADNKTKQYKEELPGLTYSIAGFIAGDNQSVLNSLPSIRTDATANSDVGVYPISFTGGEDNSYSYSFIEGTLTITIINQIITITALPEKLVVSKEYPLEATSTSGLIVLFECLDVEIASVNGNIITGVSAGTSYVRAYQPGNQNYLPAEIEVYIVVTSTHKDIMHLFTPNGDGINDYWELPEMQQWGKCSVKVYSRWGKLVFDNPDYNNLWDGSSNGTPLPEGAYYFIIETEFAGTVKGTVNIVR